MTELLNPRTYDPEHLDPEVRRLIARTVEWFESRGKVELKRALHEREWYSDFLEFISAERAFASLLTPGRDGGRWDSTAVAAYGEVLAFYGLGYWYTWQVTILGLGPVWQSDNEAARARAAKVLDDGGVLAFGLSEQGHGADIYSTDLVLTPAGRGSRAVGGKGDDDGTFLASGEKYYIGNGNVAGLVSVFGRRADVEGPDAYVFFAADSAHPAYELVDNVVNGQMYVSHFRLHEYPVTPTDVLHTGRAAFDAALNTVNVGKFQLGFASIGICEHAFHEAVTHAAARVLYGRHVTDFPHVRRLLVDSWARLVAMKMFAARATDYFRSASAEDRRYLLFNPITKMKVTSEGERVVDGLWDVIAAKGFEKDTYFSQAAMDIRALPKLEGTVHVNMALVLKFLPQYLLVDTDVPEVAPQTTPGDDAFLFDQGPTRGLAAVGFGDWRPAYEQFADVPNVAVLREQAEGLVRLVTTSPPDAEQAKDLDLLLVLGELFTTVVYGHLVLEQAALSGTDRHLVDQVFDTLVRDFSAYAVDLHGKMSASKAQRVWALDHVRAPQHDAERYAHVWEQVRAHAGAYEMRP